MRYTIIVFVSVVFLSCSNTTDTSKIRVVGEGKVRTMPNLVILTLEVGFTQPRMADAVTATQNTVDSVLLILQAYGQKQTDIKTSSISANKEYNYNGNRQVFIGFNATQTIDFVLKDITRFTELTGKLLGTRISSISRIQFGHTRADSLLREADLLAYDDAFKSASKLATRADVKLGKVTYLSNGSDFDPNSGSSYIPDNNINTYNKAYGGRGFTIAPEVLEFRRSVVAEYGLGH
jgi:uncharacterized protein